MPGAGGPGRVGRRARRRRRAVASLGVNLLVVEPAGKSISWMKQLGTAFRLAGAPAVPQALADGRQEMRIAEVTGRVTMSRLHPSLRGGGSSSPCRCRSRRLTEGSSARGEELVVYDNLGAGPGDLIGVSEGREAANPFGKNKTPVDAYCACLIDRLSF